MFTVIRVAKKKGSSGGLVCRICGSERGACPSLDYAVLNNPSEGFCGCLDYANKGKPAVDQRKHGNLRSPDQGKVQQGLSNVGGGNVAGIAALGSGRFGGQQDTIPCRPGRRIARRAAADKGINLTEVLSSNL